ncbi:hypothetical protein MMC29_002391 [Sticta canariensis]|nr:hypothetical protein [Sticta canariensis]
MTTATAATIETPGKQRPPSRFFYRFRSSPSFMLVTVCVAIFNDIFLFGTIIPVLPYALPHRMNVDEEDVQLWIVVLLSTYAGALLVGSLLFGWIGDRLSRRHAMFLSGVLMLLVATALLAVGRSLVVLVFGRLLQGFSAALVWTSGLALLTDTLGLERHGEAVGYAHTSVVIGTTSAPLVGGLVYSRAGYSAVSAMSIAVVAISIMLALVMIEPKGKTEWDEWAPPAPRFSVAGNENQTVASEITEPALKLPDERSILIQKNHNGDNFGNRPAYLLLLRSGRILASMWGIFTYAAVVVSFEGIIPLFVKETFHWDSARAALIFLSWIIPGFLGPLAGNASDRLGPRWIAVGGFLFAVPPLVSMRFVTKDSTSQKILLCALLTLVAAAKDLKRKRPREFGNLGVSSQAYGLDNKSKGGLERSDADFGIPISYSPNLLKILKTSSSPRRTNTALGKPPSHDALADPDP